MVKSFKKIVNSLPLYLQKRLPKNIEVIKISRSESQRLNRIYRKKDQPASVLSIRYSSDYGEVLLCPEIVRKEAQKQGNSYKHQMTWMVLHGMIHLAGIHHEGSRHLAGKVERLEASVLQKLTGKNSKFKSQSAKPRLKIKKF